MEKESRLKLGKLFETKILITDPLFQSGATCVIAAGETIQQAALPSRS